MMMPKTYRVFLGAPSFADIQRDPTSYAWRTFSSSPSSDNTPLSRNSTRHALQVHPDHILDLTHVETSKSTGADTSGPSQIQFTQSASVILPADLLETAGERISMIYKDVNFGEEYDDDEELVRAHSFSEDNEEKEVEVSVFNGVDQSSVFTWPSTSKDQTDVSVSRMILNPEDPSFMPCTQSPNSKLSGSPTKSQQEFSATQPESQSFGIHSWTSSISRFPSFNFSLHSLSSLSSLSTQTSGSTNKAGKLTRKVNLLLAILEIEGPDAIRIKKGVDAGKEVSILKMILGNEENHVCKLTAWREIAEEWGGYNKTEEAKRGDVVYLENVLATSEPATSITLSASTYLKPKLTICYRTMPSTLQDSKLRPDLRLAISEPCVRKVLGIVRWFEQLAGLV